MQDDPAIEAKMFIRANLPLAQVPAVPELRLHLARSSSGLSRRLGPDGAPPYWAYPWAGGTVLARYVLDRPAVVRDRNVLDLGAGSGLVAVAASIAGARTVIAAEIDAMGRAAIALNAEANGITISIVQDDPTQGLPPDVDLILGGDIFYAPDVAAKVMAFLDRCRASGIDVLIGDPGRAWLPRHRLRIVADYDVPDFGGGGADAARPSAVYAFD